MDPHTPNIPSDVLDKFTKIDKYINTNLLPADPTHESVLKANASSNLPAIDVTPSQGKFLYLLAKLNNSKHVLEVGTLGGYSAIWFAKAVGPGGKVVTLEIDPGNAKVASQNIERAGFGGVVEIKLGPAVETLKTLSESAASPKPVFDFVFIDADKDNNLSYFKYALEFSRVGTVVVVDNIGRRGRLADEDVVRPDVIGTRKLFEWLKTEEEEGRGRVESTAIQTVGEKGWDGFLIATVIA